MQVSNNVSSFNVWKNYTSNVSNLRKSMSKLSSGSRINNAGDDPSGLAMSERLRTQTRNTAAAAGNVENKLNYLQTADSWLQKVHDMLGRMGELAVMANDGTKSATDKGVLQKEFAQMQAEISRITGATAHTDAAGAGGDANAAAKFNGIELFQAFGTDGSADGITMDDTFVGITQQVGADGGQTFAGVGIDLAADSNAQLFSDLGVGAAEGGVGTATDVTITWGDLIDGTVKVYDAAATDNANTLNVDESQVAGNAVTYVNSGIDFLSEKRADIGAEMKRMDQTLDGLRSYEENITATESRIRDVDVAKETAEMSKYSILQQVGTAMLAQANQLPQGVLQLLG